MFGVVVVVVKEQCWKAGVVIRVWRTPFHPWPMCVSFLGYVV